MQLLTFDFEFQRVYSTSIEFLTQINEKHLGHEQRYPVWTYPKRIFTLLFDKSFSQRQELENFFISVNGACGKFYFTWPASKGGNDKTYICNFDKDSFEQNISDFGFSECELRLETIDDNEISPVLDFDFWHKADCNFSIDFKTISDKLFTHKNSRTSYWNQPKKKWSLSFQKNDNVRKQLENFFIAKRGKFKSFNWVWDLDKGGDGQTYKVRFDLDKLDVSIYEYGFGELTLDLIEVFENDNPLTELEKDEIIPRKLLKIELDGGSIFILDNETLESIDFDGETYFGAPLKHGEIKNDDNSSVNKLEIELSNVSLAISAIIGNRGDVITNSYAVLTLVFLNINTNQIIPGLKKILYSGRCNNLSLDYEKATIDIETELGGYEKMAPIIKYRPTCQVRRFKDCRCNYSGSATSCDRTFASCLKLGNTLNFRGFPSCVIETVIKA